MKDIEGYKGLYAACEDGKIWAYPKTGYAKAGRWKEGRYLKPYIMKNGYHIVGLFSGGNQKKFLLHRLIAQTFIPNPKHIAEVNHKNMDKSDCSVSNLEWMTRIENRRHAAKNGINNKGERHGLSKLTNENVKVIKGMLSQGFTGREIAKRFKVAPMTISDIRRGVTWTHIIV